MNQTVDRSTDSTPSGYPTAFKKIKTMPDGWDLSNQPSRRIDCLPAESTPSPEQESGEEEYSSSENTPGQAQKFTQPRTIPKGWDTSALK
jgi:uncharacterized protein YbdZ (MbtH family)